ncbi:hypothetical protein [Longimicrobium terrae]|uniref:Uncharacterized protein n=1 Tax=Longimicrobium terrae TaxID=1639882 RepID=A0A841GKJ8_9BACT|nr:hypothetical protein [Longimicrobium terrae]MBB4634722.1 hypothetical protein [Longimicrobium terrae]MBB6069117.1 hypothetical protein [Longimicrobium terrae]NNC32066.1 hypothetical protein [Longimicrobium terrae]
MNTLLVLTAVIASLGFILTAASIVTPSIKRADGRLTRGGNALLVVAVVMAIATVLSSQLQDRKARAESTAADSAAQQRTASITTRLERVMGETQTIRVESEKVLRNLETSLTLSQRLSDSIRQANVRADARAEAARAQIYRAQNPVTSIRTDLALVLRSSDPEVIRLQENIARDSGNFLPSGFALLFWSEDRECGNTSEEGREKLLDGLIVLNQDSIDFRQSKRGAEAELRIGWGESDALLYARKNLTVDDMKNVCMQVRPLIRFGEELDPVYDRVWESAVIQIYIMRFPQGRHIYLDDIPVRMRGEELLWISRLPENF